MSDLPPEFEIKLLPDWLKEQPAKNPYAHYEGERERSPRGDRPDRGNRGPQRRDGGRPSRPGDRPRGAGGPRPGSQGDQRGERRPDRGRDRRPGDSRRHEGGREHFRSREGQPSQAQQEQPTTPAPVKIEFFPENHFVEAVLAFIRSTGHAFALFDLARSFLVKQDRHRVKISVTDPSVLLYQVGERGPVCLDQKQAEKTAFRILRKQFYSEEVIEREPLKGNFTNVARCRLSGEILGPTSYHGYQPALRKHYEQRFSRRMSFQDFLREIETSNKPEDIEAWKEASRRTTVYKTLGEGEPVEFTDLSEVEAHFRKNHLEKAIQSGSTFEMSGNSSRNIPDRRISDAVQAAWEKERGFPGQMMYHLREAFVRAGLHFFKHHKRQQFISITRPQLIKEEGLSEQIKRILRALEEKPGCTRADLAQKLLEGDKESPEFAKNKAALASDLHWLRQAGNIIEFSDGKLDLPRKKNEEDAPQQRQQNQPKKQQPAAKPQEESQAAKTEPVAPSANEPAPAETTSQEAAPELPQESQEESPVAAVTESPAEVAEPAPEMVLPASEEVVPAPEAAQAPAEPQAAPAAPENTQGA